MNGKNREISFLGSEQLIQALQPFADRNRGMRKVVGYFIRITLRVAQAEPRFRLIPEIPDNSRTVREPLKAIISLEEYEYLHELARYSSNCKNSPLARNLVWQGIKLHHQIMGRGHFLLLREEEYFTRVRTELALWLAPLQ